MPFFTNRFGGKAFMGNPLPDLHRLHMPVQTNIAPVIKGIYPESKLSGNGNVTIFFVYLAQRMRITGITTANSNPYRILPVISFVFPILQFQIMTSHLIRKQNYRKGLFLPYTLISNAYRSLMLKYTLKILNE